MRVVSPPSQESQKLPPQKLRGKFKYALTRRPMQASLIVIVISLAVLLGGLYYWQVYGSFTFSASYCGNNNSCKNTFNTLTSCISYARSIPGGPNCVRVSQDKKGLDAIIVGAGLLLFSGITGFVIVVTTKIPIETRVKTSI